MGTLPDLAAVGASALEYGAGLNYAVGPVVAVVVLVLLALFARWAFGTGRGRRPVPHADGLLVPVATVSNRAIAEALRAALTEAGIRSTLRERVPPHAVVLVFPEDAERARAVAASFTVPD